VAPRAVQPLASSQPEAPGAAPSNLTNPSRQPVTPPTTSRTHIVKAGENPNVIARKYGVKVDALMAANPRLDARRLKPGQALTIPAR
jgi:LysM repeat protein